MPFELHAFFGETGATRLRNKIIDLRAKQLDLVSATQTLRTAYLYLSFGLLAAGAMATRLGNALLSVTTANIEAFRTFDHQVTITSSIMKATEDQTADLRKGFLELGKTTEWTSVQAAEVGRIFALAGKKFEDENEVIKAVGATLELATIGMVSHTEATRFAIDVTNQFGIAQDELGGVVNLVATAITNSNLTVQELATSMSYAGAASEEFGISLADTTAYMMISADAGIRGGRAGRYWREGITRVSKALGVAGKGTVKYTEASELLRKANENAEKGIYDLNGKFNGLANMIKILNEAYGGLDPSIRAVYLSALFGARNWSSWAKIMKKAREEGIQPTIDTLNAAQAAWAIEEATHLDGKKALKSLMEQYAASNKGIIKLDKTFDNFSYTQKEWIKDTIKGIDTMERMEAAINDVTMAHALAKKRLEDLHGVIIQYESSLDKLRVMMAGPTARLYKAWYSGLKLIVDALAEVHPALLGVFSIFMLVIGTIAHFGGVIAMSVGGIFMLVAALVILAQQREADVLALQWEINHELKLKYTTEEVIDVYNRLFGTQQLVTNGFRFLGGEIQLATLRARQHSIAMARQWALMAGPMLFSMLILSEGTKKGNEWMNKYGLTLMFLVTPAIQFLTFSFDKLTVSLVKNRAVMVWNYVASKLVAIANLFLASTTGEAAISASALSAATIKLTAAQVWNKIATIGATIVTKLQAAAMWLLVASLFAATEAYVVLTAAAFTFMGVTFPVWAVLLGIAAAVTIIVALFLKWETITRKLGKIFNAVFIKRHSPAFWEALQLSAKYSGENVKNFERWSKVANKIRAPETIGIAEFPEVAKPSVMLETVERVEVPRIEAPKIPKLMVEAPSIGVEVSVADKLKAMKIGMAEVSSNVSRGVQVSMFSGARISLTKETLPGFRSIIDEAVDATLHKLERML